MSFDLTNKVSIVTGAGSGIRRAIALDFAAAGAKVVAAGRTLSKVTRNLWRQRDRRGRRAVALAVDVARGEDVRGMVQATGSFRAHRRAGAERRDQPAGQHHRDQRRRVGRMHRRGSAQRLLEAKYTVSAVMQQPGGGVVINVAGTLGIRPCRGKPPTPRPRRGHQPHPRYRAGLYCAIRCAVM
ncbi:MAG: SDR family NAD(P)-dependent oxidoreductase [Caldilineaceae bacterium]